MERVSRGRVTLPVWLRAKDSGPLGTLLDGLFPPHCVACGSAGDWLCPACISSIPGRGRLNLVPRLRNRTEALAGALTLSPHIYPLREAVHGLKYGGVRVLADPLSTLLADAWRAQARTVDVVIPVPLHRAQLRRRGYNQAELLGRGFCANTGLDLCPNVLHRWRATRSQVGLSPEERLHNVAGAFACTEEVPRGVRVLLIDDVLTTGATMSACAQALCDAGAEIVWGMALTHPPGPGVGFP